MEEQNVNRQGGEKRKQNRQHNIHCVDFLFAFFSAGGTTDGKSLVSVLKEHFQFYD